MAQVSIPAPGTDSPRPSSPHAHAVALGERPVEQEVLRFVLAQVHQSDERALRSASPSSHRSGRSEGR